MPIPEFIVRLRGRIGHDPLWLASVTAVVLRGEEVLLVRRVDNGQWAPVSGIVDPGEHPADCAVREVLEETTVDVEVEGLAWVSVSQPVIHVNGDQAQYLVHVFRCRFLGGEARVGDDESLEVGWFHLDDLPPMHRVLVDRIDAAVAHEGVTRLA
ncbi:MAG: NUDIX domain-containing protein [Nocardioidaceae bacterium]